MRRLVSVSAPLCGLAVTFLLTACGGGGTTIPAATYESTQRSIQAAPEPTSTPIDTVEATSDERFTAANAAIATVGLKCNHGPPLHGPCIESVALPPAGAYSGTLTLPSGTGTLAISTSSAGIAYAPRLQATPILEITLTAKSAVTLNGRPAFAITVPATLGGSLSLAENNPLTKIAGPVAIANSAVSFPAAPGPITIARGKSVLFALYGGVLVPKPSPTPTSVTVSVVVTDYFSNATLAPSIHIDGVASTSRARLQPGLHQLQITAPGYATYNGAIQLPGGSLDRTIALFPMTPAVAAWLAQINADRAANGGGMPVQLDSQLSISAFDHAVDMETEGYFAHFDPKGFAPTTRALLLGSEMVGDENLAAGFSTWSDAEAAFVAEKVNLAPNNSTCQLSDQESAGHFCNIVWPTHNWVGLAIAGANTATGQGPEYDEEFGDLYGMVDTTVIAPEPALNTTASLILGGVASAYESNANGLISTFAVPVPITVAELDADPTCASTCPAADQWYPTLRGFTALGTLTPLVTSANELIEPQVEANTFSATGAATIYWPSGTVMPETSHDITQLVQTQTLTQSTARRAESLRRGRIVPNSALMLHHR